MLTLALAISPFKPVGWLLNYLYTPPRPIWITTNYIRINAKINSCCIKTLKEYIYISLISYPLGSLQDKLYRAERGASIYLFSIQHRNLEINVAKKYINKLKLVIKKHEQINSLDVFPLFIYTYVISRPSHTRTQTRARAHTHTHTPAPCPIWSRFNGQRTSCTAWVAAGHKTNDMIH